MKRSFIREILEAIDEETISFAGGLPNSLLFPVDDLKSSANNILKKRDVWQYSLSNGIKSLRKKIAKEYCKEGFETTSDNILITTGSQQALYILARYFEKRSIVLEAPSYLGAINTFKLNNLKMKIALLKTDGIEIKTFEKAFEKAKLAYLIPDFQNPTGTTYSKSKREEVAKIVKKNNGLIIEDSPYSELFFEEKNRSISSLIPNNSFHLGSFSKTLSPSLRIGWIRASKKLIQELLVIKESIDLHSCGLSQHLLNEYLKDDKKYQMHLEILRKFYKEKSEYFCKQLDTYLPEFSYIKPKGGMFVYGEFKGIDSFELLNKCMKKKVVFVPGCEFYLNNKNFYEIRFNFTNSSLDDITKGIKIIAEEIRI
ncbi:MAG: PLP-dependent aminotransferase family protein [Arcobacter sp.]|mgnify:CR=1 FL=1|uniref:aminotransferase-like domain-containing protein n=1 Tax=uncultured Arcobacter sp. TaxID=165434 RepID=UPI000CAC7808|nr:PLP-dependent aminotransferase family protein [uncultured Arcobacter sp.]PLY08604.1 MAG: PLP-dependent aminotransferase family protein [Arcobacter sp.]